MFDDAKKKWEGIFTDESKILLSPSHLAVCVASLQDIKQLIRSTFYSDQWTTAENAQVEDRFNDYWTEYNLVSKTDPDGYTTEYTYNALDLVTKINYNDAKEVSYRYNKTGDLVSMTDWLDTTTFELDLLHQMTAATDHAGKRVEYTYDGVGNQTSIKMIWRSFATLKKLPLLLY